MRKSLWSVLGIISALTVGIGNTAEAQVEDIRNHNGFYLQLTGGLGYVSTSADDATGDMSMGGLALDTSLLLGGTPIPGLAIGGGLMIDYMPSPSVTVNDMDFDTGITSQYLVGIGLFGDFYPDPAGGLHFQAFVGWGGLESSFEGNVGGSDPTGLVMTIAGGYDVFISDELSVGGLARLGFAPLSIEDTSYTSIAPALLGTLTYH